MKRSKVRYSVPHPASCSIVLDELTSAIDDHERFSSGRTPDRLEH